MTRLFPKGQNPGDPAKGQQATPSRKAPGHEKRMRAHAERIRSDPDFHTPSDKDRRRYKKVAQVRLSTMAKKYEKKRLEREERKDEQSKPRYHRKAGQIGASNKYNPRHQKDVENRRSFAAQPGTGRTYREVLNWKVGRAEDALKKATTPEEKAKAQRSLKTWQSHLQRQADINPATGVSKEKKAEENTMNTYEKILTILLESHGMSEKDLYYYKGRPSRKKVKKKKLTRASKKTQAAKERWEKKQKAEADKANIEGRSGTYKQQRYK